MCEDEYAIIWTVTSMTPSEPVRSGPLGRSARAVHERLSPFGLSGEVFSEEFPLVAFTVPADADLGGIKAMLSRGQEDGWWHFEAGCVTDAWRNV